MERLVKDPSNPHYTKGFRAEIPDPRPIELPIGYEHPESLESMIQRMIRKNEESRQRDGYEDLDEANDFDVDDDPDMVLQSGHTYTELQEEKLKDDIKSAKQQELFKDDTDNAGSDPGKTKDNTDSNVEVVKEKDDKKQ